MIVVLDANTVIAGLLSSEGPCAEILDRWRDGQFDIAVCPAFVAELQRVLRYPRITRGYRVRARPGAAAVAELSEQAEFFADTIDPPRLVPDDENDDYILALAEVAGAALIVTRDRHFDAVNPTLATGEIIPPEEFLRRLRQAEPSRS